MIRRLTAFAALLVLLVSGAVVASDESYPRFDLTGHDGGAVTSEHFRGRPLLVAFGFTRCEHICPMIAANMAAAIRLAEEQSAGIFISVDTERDTPALTHQYAARFSDRMTGLSGSYEQITEAANNFDVTYVVTKSQASYTVQHTPHIFLLGPDGVLVDTFAMTTNPAEIAAALDRLGR